MAYTTKTKVEEYLNDAVNLTDDYFSSILSIVETKIDSVSNNTYGSTTVTEYLNLENSTTKIYLKHPIITITLLQYNKIDEFNPDWEDLDYAIIDSDYGEVSLYQPVVGNKSLKVTYTYGYSTIPKQIETLATLMCSLEVLKKVVHTKALEDDSSDISLGGINITNGFKNSLELIRMTKRDINELFSLYLGTNSNVV